MSVEQAVKYLAEANKLLRSELYERAMVEFSKALAADIDTTRAELERLNQESVATDDYRGFIAIASNLLVKDKSNVNLANMLGNAYRRTGDLVQAEKLYLHALEIDPEAELPAYNLAATMAQVDMYDDSIIRAISEFEQKRVFQLPEDQEGEVALKDIQEQINFEKKEQEEKELQAKIASGEIEPPDEDEDEYVQPELVVNPVEVYRYIFDYLNPDSETGTELLTALGIHSLNKKVPEVAYNCFKYLVKKSPKNANFRCFLVLCYVLKGRADYTVDTLVAMLGKDPYLRYANANLGIIYNSKREVLLARKYFIFTHQLLENSKGYYDIDLFRKQGDEYFEEEYFKKALAIYEAIAKEQEEPPLLFRIGQIYIELGDFPKALQVFNRMQAIDPDNERAKEAIASMKQRFVNHAEDLMTANKYSKALVFFRKALTIEKDEEIMKRMIQVFELLKDTESAKKMTQDLHELQDVRRQEQQETHRLEKIEEAESLEAQKNFHGAIRAYEEAFRLKASKEVFMNLAKLYKRTKQLGMIQDLANRYNRMVELEELKNQEQKDATRQKNSDDD